MYDHDESVVIGGSSPRGRGTAITTTAGSVNYRFIPAWAGNRRSMLCSAAIRAVHPRVGGEQRFGRRLGLDRGGSSPRGRGTGDRRRARARAARFIPAWAGNSSCAISIYFRRPVHPRVGGEQNGGALPSASSDGSSPRGRGTAMIAPRSPRWMRFIPAWAGNSQPRFGAPRSMLVHPRVGGEQVRSDHCTCQSPGSSPRGRGTGWRNRPRSAPPRFIPAWAGNMRPPECRRRIGAVHPRVGGEQEL